MVAGLQRARRGMAVLAASVLAAVGATAVSAPVDAESTAPAATTVHTIAYDKYSLMIDGQRTMIWSGEFHYWRLPSPSLWRDVLQKMKAEGYNAVSIYFDWAYHSPKQGVYDFTGVRNVDELLDMAQQAGLYVIARPGPYINAETSAGGFPGWLMTQAGRARSDAPDYLSSVDEWFTAIDGILARHQLTNGTGTVIAYQIENELASTGTSQRNYLRHLYDKVRADGIEVPIFHNDKGRNGIWVPSSSTVAGTVPGPTDLYAFDGYPGGTCHTDGTPGGASAAPDWGIQGPGGATGGASASPDTPGFVAEFGGGWFDYWGSVGTYPCMAVREGPGYERVFYDTNIANRLTLQNFYMTFGGTSWGWLPAPVVYTSYDYGAAFDEARQIRPKATTMKELGLFLQSVAPISKVDAGPAVTPSNPRIKVYDDVNPDTGTHFYIAVHNPSSATTNDAFALTVATADGTYSVPQSGALRVNGQDAKILVADYDMDGQHLVYSTSEIMTHLVQDGKDIALLYGRDGENGETVLRYGSAPHVKVVSGDVTSVYDPTTGDLRLDYTHNGLAVVKINGGNRPQSTLLLADEDTAGTFWLPQTSAGPVLVRGPELVRTATLTGSTLALIGDTVGASDLEIWAPAQAHQVTWNGGPVATSGTPAGSQRADTQLAGAAPVTLPDLSGATWRTAVESPEASPSYDDSAWVAAAKTSTNSTTRPPAGQPVLTADDYGFHQGDVWYRGHYSNAATAATISLRYGAGGAGMLQAWLDGVYLGQNVLAANLSSPPTTGTATFTIPSSLGTAGDHELSVMVRDDGHNEDGGVNDAQKEGRGLIAVTMANPSSAAVPLAASWKIQGNLGGEDVLDTARGSNNVGGLYGERNGWYLPGYPDQSWLSTSVPAASAAPGTQWYRTSFPLDIPAVDDASLGVTIGDPSTPHSNADYRALIYVNGWNIGQYIANVGPQHTFVVPNGILDSRGKNTLAIAVTSNGGAGNGLERVSLTNLGTVRGGVPVTPDAAPSWSRSVYGPPSVPGKVTVDGLTSDAGNPVRPGDAIHVTGTLTNRGTDAATNVTARLDTPAGWVATTGDAPTFLSAGASATAHWTVTVPTGEVTGSYQLAAVVSYTVGATSGQTGSVLALAVRSTTDQYVSDLPFVSATNGFGPVERDQNVGGTGLGDGGPITLRGTVYPKGVGTNAVSQVVVNLGGACQSFNADVGIDDSAAGRGSVTFTVLADGVQVAATGTLTGASPVQHIAVDITGAQTLTLQVGDAGDGIGHDNGDWAGAEVHCSG